MDVFFHVFKVAVPPFPTPDHFYYDDTFLGAGTYLAHTRKLTLSFTASNPWYELHFGPWAEEDAEGVQHRERGDICTSGLIIDWILTYHIQSIELQGDIQEWVKKKWYQVFAGTHPEQNDIASQQRIYDIQHHGEQQKMAAGNAWVPTEHYPPTCVCEVPCRRLRHGIVDSEVCFSSPHKRGVKVA
ncbi:uncharacterized protein N0V89_000369 [Didymosphaeria variabile]|uniref:Uncharacterized protein n=1 Tax=Didymosphaeria variabile TaxID=1932322 RepID=A0A9W8XV10_9PLEO|nr:uncharacterized protein N0V89_000369 [Didymosphaeria variabile]KAJ4359813.1 hypothetical protein N0V89_000369 [Didymosphaeria variabile]